MPLVLPVADVGRLDVDKFDAVAVLPLLLTVELSMLPAPGLCTQID